MQQCRRVDQAGEQQGHRGCAGLRHDRDVGAALAQFGGLCVPVETRAGVQGPSYPACALGESLSDVGTPPLLPLGEAHTGEAYLVKREA